MESEPAPSADPVLTFQTEELGRLTVDDLRAGQMMDVEETLGGREISPAELTNALLAVLARTEGGEILTREQIGQLSEKEKEEFAELLVKSQDHFYHDQIPTYKKNEQGKTIASYHRGDVSLPRDLNETALNYLYRGWMKYRETVAAIARKLTGPIIDITKISKWLNPSILEAITKNATISGELSKNIATMHALGGYNFASATPLFKAAIGVPKLPDWKSGDPTNGRSAARDTEQTATSGLDGLSNGVMSGFRSPAVGTNERLDSLLGRFDRFEVMAGQTIELVQSMNGIASGLLQKFAEGARITERFARISIGVAITALVLTLFQAGYDVLKSYRSDEDTRLIVKEVVSQLTDAQRQTTTEIRSTMIGQADRNHLDQSELAKAIAVLGDALRALKERSVQEQPHDPPRAENEPGR